MRDQATRRLAYGGLMAALIALLTAYVHLSVFIPCRLATRTWAMSALFWPASSWGRLPLCLRAWVRALVDVLLGAFATYAPFTLVIKGVMGFVLGKFLVAKRFSVRNACCCCSWRRSWWGAYFLTDTLLYGVEAAIGSVVGTACRAASCSLAAWSSCPCTARCRSAYVGKGSKGRKAPSRGCPRGGVFFNPSVFSQRPYWASFCKAESKRSRASGLRRQMALRSSRTSSRLVRPLAGQARARRAN